MTEKFTPFTPAASEAPASGPVIAGDAAANLAAMAASMSSTVSSPPVAPAAPSTEATQTPAVKTARVAGAKAPGVAIPGNYGYTRQAAVLEVDNVSIHYDSPILREVSFKIDNIVRPGLSQGQVVALLAPSGMGKTQLFRCISGLKVPNSGMVYIGEDRQPTRAGKVGVVAQDYPLFNHLTVFQNILAAAKLKLNAKEAAERTITLLERFELDQRRNVYPHQLSGGQRQRVAIIQQMVACGHLLLMDEPFSGLDVLMKERVQDMITQLAAEDELNTIILTTHDIQSAIAVSDTILVLGRERDQNGHPIPGARIVRTYDLMEMGLAWRPNVTELPQFTELDREINARFHEL
jgi:NitT/TauT family transport system ATP-binding protein